MSRNPARMHDLVGVVGNPGVVRRTLFGPAAEGGIACETERCLLAA